MNCKKFVFFLLTSFFVLLMTRTNVVAAPSTPTGLTATGGDGKVDLSWNKNPSSEGVDTYFIYRKDPGYSTYDKLVSVPSSDKTYTDATGIKNCKTYSYKISAMDWDTNAESALSSAVSATPKESVAPSTPSGLSAVSDESSVTLNWTANTETDLLGYRVYHSTDNSTFSRLFPSSNVDTSTNSISDTSLTAGVTYYYQVSAVDQCLNESPRTSLSVTLIAYTVERTGTSGQNILFGDTTKTGFKLKQTPGDYINFSSITWKVVDKNSACSANAITDMAKFDQKTSDVNEKEAIFVPLNLAKEGKICAEYPKGKGKFYSYPTTLRIVYNLSGTLTWSDRSKQNAVAVPQGIGVVLIQQNGTGGGKSQGMGASGSFSFTDVFDTNISLQIYGSQGNVTLKNPSTSSDLFYEVSNYGSTYDTKIAAMTTALYDGTNNISFSTQLDGDKRGMFNILKYAQAGYNYYDTIVKTNTNITSRNDLPALTITWEPGYNTRNGTSYYVGGVLYLQGGDVPLGGFKDVDEWDEAIILHEFGHFVQEKLAAKPLGAGGNHTWNKPSNQPTAYSEGFATFYSCLVREWFEPNVNTLSIKPSSSAPWQSYSIDRQNSSKYLFYVDTGDSVFAQGEPLSLKNIENSLVYNIFVGPPYAPNASEAPPGYEGQSDRDTVEGSVASSLWDIYDANNGTNDMPTAPFQVNNQTVTINNDTLTAGLTPIWNAFLLSPNNFLDFTLNFNFTSVNRAAYLTALAAHGINYNDTTAPNTYYWTPSSSTNQTTPIGITMKATDNLIGVDHFDIQWRWVKGQSSVQLPSFTCEPSEKGLLDVTCTTTVLVSTSYCNGNLNNCRFDFFIRAVDRLQNTENFPVSAQTYVLIDLNGPEYQVITPPPSGTHNKLKGAGFAITLIDKESGVNTSSVKLELIYITKNTSKVLSPVIDGNTLTYAFTGDEATEEGEYKLVLTVSDNAGNTTSQEVGRFTIDLTPPTLQITALPQYTKKTSFTVQWNGQDKDNLSPPVVFDVQYKVGTSGTWTNWLTGTTDTPATFGPSSPVTVTDNTYYFQVRACDAAGNCTNFPGGNGNTNIIVDLTPPVATLTNVSPNYGTNAQGQLLIKETVDIIGKTTDANFDKYSVYFEPIGMSCPSAPDVETNRIVSSTTAVSSEGTLASWTTGNVSSAAYTLCLVARDQAGNVTQNTLPVYVDNTPPAAMITSPGFSGFPVVLTSGIAYIYGIVNDPNFKEYKVGFAPGVPPTTGFVEIGFGHVPVGDKTKPSSDILAIWHVSDPNNPNDPTLNLVDGNYTLKLTATDVLGNQSVIDRAMSIDRSGPQITLLSNGSTNVIQYNLSESGSTNIVIQVPGSPITLTQEAIQGKNEVVWDGGGSAIPARKYSFVLTAYDDAKNENTVTGFVTKTGLVISNVNVTQGTQPCCTFSFSSSKAAAVTLTILNLNQSGARVNAYTGVTKTDLTYTFFWDGRNKYGQLVENGDYTLALEVADSAGNKASATSNFSVSNGVSPTNLTAGGSGLRSDVTPPTGTWAQNTQLHIKQRIVDVPTLINISDKLRVDIVGSDSRDRPAVYRAYTYLEIAKNVDPDPNVNRDSSAFVWDGEKQDGGFYTAGSYEYDAFDSSGNILLQTLPSVSFNLNLDSDAPSFSTSFQNNADNSFTATVSFNEPVRPYALKVYDSDGNYVGSTVKKVDKDAFDTVNGVPLRKWALVTNPLLWPSAPLPPDTYHFKLSAKDVAGNLLPDTDFEYKFEHPIDSVTGGDVWSKDRKARLIVPPGALQTGQLTNLSIAQNVAPPFGEGFDFLDKFYDFQPNGVTFNPDKPAILRLYYDDADNDGWVEVNGVPQNIREEDLAIYNFDPVQNKWIRLGGITNRTANYLEIPLYHVSLYALVYPKEKIPPTAQITSPAENQVVEGVVHITGTATDANFSKYRLMVGEGTSPTTWTVLADSPSSVNNGTLASWDTKGLSGSFVIRLDVWDKSNNHAQDTATVSIKAIPTDTTPPSVSFVTVLPTPFSPNNDGKKDTATLSFYLSENAYLTVTVLGSAGNTVRSLYAANVSQGTQNIVWDGKDDYGSFVFSGTYTLKITAQDAAGNKGTNSASVVVDTVKPVVSVVQVNPTAFSPNNDGIADTVTFSYTLSEGGYVTANVLNSANNIVYRFFVTPKLQPPQMQTVTWDGTGNTGEGQYFLHVSAEDLAGNVSDVATGQVLLDFGPPEIKNVADSPDPFSPNNATSIGVKDTTLISADIVKTGSITWEITLKNTAGTPVKNFTGSTKSIQQVWDGKDSSGTFVPDGTYTYTVNAADAIGNKAIPKSGTVSVDDTNPQTTLSAGTPLFEANGRKYITSSTTLTLSAADPAVNGFASGLSSTQYRIDGGNYTAYASAFTLSEGIHTIEYQSVDNVGNTESLKSQVFYVDNTPPVTTLSTGDPKYQTADKVYITPATPVTLTSSDPVASSVSSGVARMEYKIDGGNYTAYASALTLSEGIHTVTYRSVDNVGNTEQEKSQLFYVDATPPVTTLTPSSPLFNNLYAPLSTTYTLSAVDPVTNGVASGVMKIIYRVDGGTETQYSQPISLTEGEHTITYYAKDNVLNTESQKSFTVRVDNTPPVTQFVPSAPLFANLYAPLSTTYTFTATDPVSNGVASGVAKIQYTLDGGVTNTYNGNPVRLTESIHTFVYYATDNVQNVESQKTVTVYVDNTPPVTTLTVGNPQYSSGGKLYISEKTTLSLTALDPVSQNVSSGVSMTQYRMDGGSWNTYVSPFTLPEGVRLVEYRSLDNVQNTEAAKSITLYVDGTPPQTAISIGTPQCTVYANPVVTYATPFTLTPTDPVKNNVASGVNFTQYRINSGNWQTYTANFTIPTSFSDGTMTIDYRSQDNVENLESIKTQKVILDNASPTTQILSPQANSITNNTIAVVGVVTDAYFGDKGNYTVEYGAGSSPSSFTTIQSAMFEQRNCTVDNPTCTPLTYWNTAAVTQNQTYTVRVSSQDCVGNAASTKVTFKVGEPPFVLSFGTKSQGQHPNDGEFNEPAGLSTIIANDGSENIAVSDKQNHRIQIFTDKGQFVTKFGQKAHGQAGGGEFNEPTEIVTDSSGNLYVVDSLDDRVQKFDKNYTFVAVYGSHGSAGGQFIKPYGVARDATGNLYVTDRQNNRVQKLDSNGNFIKEWTSIKKTTNGVDEFLTFNKPGGILVDATGNIFVSDSQNDRIVKFTQDGALILSIDATGQTQAPSSYGDHPLKQPLGMMLDNFGNLYVADQMNHRVQKFDPWGFRLLNFGTKTQGGGDPAGTFNQVADVLLDSTQKFIYVSDIYNHRVQRFAIVTDAPPVAKALAQNQNKDTIISDPNLLTILKVIPYPTPTKGKLSFNLEAEGNVAQITLEVYTINGKRVFVEFLPVMAAPGAKGNLSAVTGTAQAGGKYKADSPSLDAAIESLPNGVYVYRLQISNGVKTVNKTGKFVVVK